MAEVALLGGGGLAIELLDYMIAEKKKPVGYYAPMEEDFFKGVLPWLGDEKDAYNKNFEYIVASGVINIRLKMINFIEHFGLVAGTFTSNKSYISSFSKIGKGAVILPNAMVTGNPIIGEYLFLNMQSAVTHDSIVGNNVVVNPGVHITGHCQIGDNVSFGANSSLLPGTKIGNNSEIAICTFSKKKVGENKIVVSVPGRIISK